MYDQKFDDYIELYKNINLHEWITIFEENEDDNMENDIFTFCSLLDVDKVNENNYMNKCDWGFSVGSFGKSYFGSTYNSKNNDIYFNNGEFDDNFEYLVALRYFEKYPKIIEINPKLIWYYNLVKENDNYLNPLTDETIIKTTEHKIQVRREYLKDFLCSIHKVCVIVFDHRRYFNKTTDIEFNNEDIYGKNYFISRNILDNRGGSVKYDSISNIIGKVLITPFKNPHHPDYKQYTESDKFESFIIGYDEDEDEMIEYTCEESKLANYFGGNSEAPHFLTATYFNIKVLDKYKNDPRNYTIKDSQIIYLNEWSIPFSYNEENKITVWLGDLGRIPYGEQKYWKAFNEKPKGGVEKNFFKREIEGVWTDASRIESKLVPTINKFNSLICEKYGEELFLVLSNADKEIYNTFMLPTNFSMPEYQSFLLKLTKLTVESINVKLIKKVMGNKYSSNLGSVLQLGEFLKYTKIDEEGAVCRSIKLAYDSRNKLAGHKASAHEYNKIWGRNKEYKFNSIEDARVLLENIIGSLEYAMKEEKKYE